MALQLYQPSGIKGILLKKLFPFLHNFGFVRNRIGASIEDYTLSPELISLAEKAFQTKDLEFSVFGGTPSVHQKTTIQFFKGKEILGYCKISCNPDIKALFYHEKDLLDYLNRLQVKEVPQCLYCGEDKNGNGIFIQSTKKKPNSKSPSSWTDLHEDFLQRLSEDTATYTIFDNTDFAGSLRRLKANLHLLPENLQAIIEKNLETVWCKYRGKEVIYSTFHADFTPWNMFVDGNHLFVFDWEYGAYIYPPMLDKYHFFVQQMIHVSHLSPLEIKSNLEKENWYQEDMMRFYLLDIISGYLNRDKENISEVTLNQIKDWTKML